MSTEIFQSHNKEEYKCIGVAFMNVPCCLLWIELCPHTNDEFLTLQSKGIQGGLFEK